MARPSKMTDELVGKLEYAFSIGASIEEACFYADIHKDTYYEWKKKNPELSDRFDAMRQRPVFLAKETVLKGLQRDPDLALKYLERKKRDEFSLKTEQDLNHSGEVSFVNDVPRPSKDS